MMKMTTMPYDDDDYDNNDDATAQLHRLSWPFGQISQKDHAPLANRPRMNQNQGII